ncbi:hypothetical protein LTS15_009527 [Exophiala xenobiotica]|nr:hypothetical protein LTS15_009527 [Exophiala xenobiotica]
MTSRRSIAPILSAPVLDWESHKDIIEELYIKKDRPLGDVRQELEKWYAFQASIPQYKRKLKAWGLEKNHKSSEWQAIDRSLKRRNLDQSTARVTIKNSTLRPRKIERGLRRHVVPSLKRKWEALDSPDTPEHIHIVKAFPRELVIPVLDLPGLQLIESTRRLLSHSERPPSRANSHIPSLLRPTPTFPGQTFHRGAATSPCKNTGSASVYSCNLEVSSLHHHTSLEDTLIYGSSGVVRDSSGSGSSSPDIVSLHQKSIGRTLCAYFPKQDPVHISYDLSSRLCAPNLAVDQVLIIYAIYICSNNLVHGKEFDNTVDIVLLEHQHQLLDYFSHLSSASLQRFQEGVLLHAARHGRIDLLDLLASHHVNLSRPIRSRFGEVTTALREAIVNKQAAFCERLIGLRVDVDVDVSAPAAMLRSGGHRDQTTIALAAQYLPEVAGLIFRNHLRTFDRDRILFEAIEAGENGDEVCRLVSQGANVNCMDQRLWTPLHYAISRQDQSLTKCLLDNGARPDGATTESMEPTLRTLCSDGKWQGEPTDFMTPLALAADLTNLGLCEQLLEAGADVNLAICDRLPQFFLDDYGDQMRDLVDTMSMKHFKDLHWNEVDRTTSLADYLCDNDEYYEVPICFSTALEYAIRAKSTAVVELLLKCGADLSMRYTTSPLILALLQGQGECVELLLDCGANPREVGGHKFRIDALQAASMTGPMCNAERLIRAGADINSRTHGVQGLTALQWAAVRGDLNLLYYLLSQGADVNALAATEYGYTALQAAVLVECEQVVNLLLDWGAEVNSGPSKVAGFTALSAAIYVGNELLFWKLIKTGADVNLVEWENCDNLNIHLLSAAEESNPNFMQWLLELGVDLDMSLRSGYTLREMAVLRATEAGNLTTVHLLLGKNSILSSRILTKALHSLRLRDNGAWDVAYALLDRGADLRCQPQGFQTMLQKACTDDSFERVQELVRRGADVNAPSPRDYGRTALQSAAERGELSMVEFLLDHRAFINAPSAPSSGRTALQAASDCGGVPLVKLLLARGAHVNAQPAPKWGRTALQSASAGGHVPTVELLLDRGAFVNAQPSPEWGRTALQIASEMGHVPLVELLLENGADVNAPACEHSGVTALQAAAIMGYVRIAQMLIAEGADVGAPPSPSEGRTALNGAAEHGRLDMVKLLLDNYRLKEGESLSKLCDEAAEYARREYHWGVVDLLEGYQRGPNSSP